MPQFWHTLKEPSNLFKHSLCHAVKEGIQFLRRDIYYIIYGVLMMNFSNARLQSCSLEVCLANRLPLMRAPVTSSDTSCNSWGYKSFERRLYLMTNAIPYDNAHALIHMAAKLSCFSAIRDIQVTTATVILVASEQTINCACKKHRYPGQQTCQCAAFSTESYSLHKSWTTHMSRLPKSNAICHMWF